MVNIFYLTQYIQILLVNINQYKTYWDSFIFSFNNLNLQNPLCVLYLQTISIQNGFISSAVPRGLIATTLGNTDTAPDFP